MYNCNFILVGLGSMNFKKICESFAKEIDFYYLNTEELIDYSLFDKKKMADICGVGYMERQEVNIIKSVNDYENTVISMTYETFSKNISSINKKNKVIYLSVTKKQLEEEFNKLKEQTESQKTVSAKKSSILSNLGISLIVFEERDKFLKKNCNIEVKCDIYNIKEMVSSIYASINK